MPTYSTAKSAQHILENMAREGTASSLPVAAIADFTHTALTGTPDDTLADITTADAALEADLKDIAVKINFMLAAMRAAGIVDDAS